MEYLGLLADDGANGLRLIARYDNSMPGWDFTPGDRFYVADFNGDGKKDLFVFNGSNWAIPYVGMLRSTGHGLLARQALRREHAELADAARRPARTSATSRATARRTSGSSTASTGRSRTWACSARTATSLSMSKRYDGTMPGWQMRPNDRHYVGDFDGDGKADLYVFNGDDWSIAYLGMLKSTGSQLSDDAPLRRQRARLADAQERPALDRRT